MSVIKFVSCMIMLWLLFPASSFGYTILKTFHQGQYGPGGLAYDEVTDTLWASDIISKIILKINPNTGGVIGSLYVGYNSLPTGLAYRNGYLWNSDQWAVPEIIHKVNPANGSSLGSIPGLGGLTFDNQGRLWSTNWDIELRALNPNNGDIVDTISLPGFNPSYDQIMGLGFDNDTETLWVSVVEDRWNPPAQNWLLNVALDGTVLSTEEFDPNPALDGYEIGGLAFDDDTDTLWVNYSYFDRPPTFDDTYIYELSMGPSICECDMVPDATAIPRGGTLGFQAGVTNNTDLTGWVAFATHLTLPGGGRFPASGWVNGPFWVHLDSYGSASGPLSLFIPSYAPVGLYTYHGTVGLLGPPPQVFDTCQFQFEVIE